MFLVQRAKKLGQAELSEFYPYSELGINFNVFISGYIYYYYTFRPVLPEIIWFSCCRFDDASLFYHDQPADGLVRVIRLAMYQKYPKYLTEGFEALYSRPPVIYLSAAARPGLGEYICQQVH